MFYFLIFVGGLFSGHSGKQCYTTGERVYESWNEIDITTKNEAFFKFYHKLHTNTTEKMWI